MSARSATARTPLRALLETLRAPLLLSPVADILAGWTVAQAAWSRGEPADASAVGVGLGTLALAAGVGCCLLAAGMAQNALVDLPEDRLVKPQRPLPSGAIRPRTILFAYLLFTLLGLLLATAISRPLLLLAGAIMLGTITYHARLKRFRLAGCVLLGLLRGMDMALGAIAWISLAHPGAMPGPGDAPLVWRGVLSTVALYAAYMTGASLHASTDDEQPAAARASTRGLALAGAALLLAAAAPAATAWGDPHRAPAVWVAGTLLAAWAVLRLVRAARSLPPPAVTGVALSGLFLFDAAACLGTARWPAAVLAAVCVLVLFGTSRLALRVFPPT